MDLTISSIQRFVSPSFFSEGNKLVVVVLLSGKGRIGWNWNWNVGECEKAKKDGTLYFDRTENVGIELILRN